MCVKHILNDSTHRCATGTFLKSTRLSQSVFSVARCAHRVTYLIERRILICCKIKQIHLYNKIAPRSMCVGHILNDSTHRCATGTF
ncbi:MAG: hypothetical protein Harvfovirus76_3 [Harvfovirus sp.]|uniref:Uncharacterized protein n=1 Tax=Harvfovirus sp. TaxID=2487768 RepID=A0A3G5A3U5_9VIRU|nr:MAG: hypothetical protein Harvfovirus76_3 [Harvfovirus sp.]